MYEIKANERHIDGMEVSTYSREIISANIIEVEAGTNGYQGGDSGHGCRTYFKIKDVYGTDIEVNPIFGATGSEGFEVVLGGDCELSSFIKALKFAVKVLEDQAQEVDD